MKTRIVRIGNSRGVRIPKPLLEQAGLEEEVEIRVEEGAIVIRPLRQPREGWSQALRAMAGAGEDHLVDPETPTDFDREEWEW